MEDLSAIQTQMKKGLLEFAILTIVSKKKVYSSEILKVLEDAELITSQGTLYPLLSRLKSEGFCDYYWEESSGGHPRKYYTLTEKGEKQLRIQEKAWEGIQHSINFLVGIKNED